MKHLKTFVGVGLIATAVAATFGAGSALGTAFYNGATKLGVGSSLDFSLKSGTKVKITNTTGTEVLDECSTSTDKGKLTSAGGAAATVKRKVETLTWEGCTVPTTTTKAGEQETHWISGTTIGTVTSSTETSVSINTIFFGVCVYGAPAGTHLGTFTGNLTPPVMDLNEIVVKREGSNFACPETTKVTATYTGTEPASVRVEQE
jgi:hypothetical protein